MGWTDPHLQRREANFQPLNPVRFMARENEAHPERTAVRISGGEKISSLEVESVLHRHKVPRDFIFNELPETATGKIQKFVLREQASGYGQ